MLFSGNRDEMRDFYYKAWHKHQHQQPLEAIEQQIVLLILEHPEYQKIIEDQQAYQTYDFSEVNPFLHFGLHIALRDQIGLNQPEGITDIYQKLVGKLGNAHEAEHQMMDVLAHTIFDLLNNKKEFNAVAYLEAMHKL